MKQNNNKKKIISIILFLILLGGFVYIGTRDYKDKETDEHKIFSKEFSGVDEKNIFKYINSTQANSAINSGNGIIFFGFSKNEFTGPYAAILNEVAMQCGIKEILYYDFYEDRKNNNGTYENIVNQLKTYLLKNDTGKIDIMAPSLLIIKNGEIQYYDDETSQTLSYVTPKSYWTEYNKGAKVAIFTEMFKQYLEVK